ncbi:RNA 2',3'-cyclic phosphodiesterase [Aeribacillus sp. FSL K6-8394]|uniref:RNA 2',3'-cyclic phosphodiesterase n=1 Tax=Aeribacillus sp. FSL K6-8394 TaxID=2954570 RepID=UPI0030FC7F59
MQKHYFLALDVPIETAKSITKWISANQDRWHFSRYVHPFDYHVTLVFLGNVDAKRLALLSESLLEPCRKIPSFSLELSEAEIFGKREHPRILWVGVKENELLYQLRNEVYNTCKAFDFSLDERPFRPHITVARKWEGQLSFSLEEKSDPYLLNEHIHVGSVTLFQTNIDQTPKYEAIKQIPLGG